MILLEISADALRQLDTTLWTEITSPAKCDSCRQALSFRLMRAGSVSEKLHPAKRITQKVFPLPKLIAICLDAPQIATLYTEEHLKISQPCPHCSDMLEITIFLNHA